MSEQRLTGKQEAWCIAYVGAAHFNGTEASRIAGYKGTQTVLSGTAYDNLRKPHIKARLEELMADTIMSSKEVAARLGEMSRGERPTKRITDDTGERQFYDEESALELLGKYHAIFTERHIVEQIDGLEIVDDDEGPTEDPGSASEAEAD